ncbi:MAG: hypothetical protein LBF64_01855 [Oscillospiraceae bacterium]|jgi:hypothetical protein|nr:hypothetical protein [Oscillospiraceae bacterium]
MRERNVIKRMSVWLAAAVCLLALWPAGRAYAAGDSVRIVSVTPDVFPDYETPVTFVVTVSYTLQSVDSGVVYLGFNTNAAERYSLVDEAVVSKGTGVVTLTGTVTPVGWGTADSPSGPLQGSLELLNGNTFGAYVNISENPHPDAWNPLAADVLPLKQGTPENTAPPAISEANSLLPLAPTIDFDSGLAEHFSITLDWGVDRFSRDATVYYDNELAMAGLALSGAAETTPGAEGETRVKTMLEQMGFEKVNSFWYNYSYNDRDTVACSFASKKIFVNGEYYNLIVVVNRGSVGSIFDNWNWIDFNWKNDWISNLGGATSFRNAANKVHAYLQSYITNANIDTNTKTKLFITGHSRGGVVANILGTLVGGIATQANTYVYTFAAPKANASGADFSNIINILNEEDTIPKLSPLDRGRYGQDKWFHRNDATIKERIYQYFSAITNGKDLEAVMQGTLWLFDYPRSEFEKIAYAHDTATYLARLCAADLYDADAPRRYTKTVAFHCPVDIEISNSDGTTVGRIENSTVNYDIASDLLMWVEGDDKYILMDMDSDYIFTAIGTDSGQMTYSVQVADLLTDAGIEETQFYDVSIEIGKRMSSEVNGKIAVSDVELLVVDDEGNPFAKIMPDGAEVSLAGETESPSEKPAPASPSLAPSTTAEPERTMWVMILKIALVWAVVAIVCAVAIAVGLHIRKKRRAAARLH